MPSLETDALPDRLPYTDDIVSDCATGYINAGGRGTRLNPIFDADPEFGIAKALLEVGDPPVKLVDHHIATLAQTALRNTVIGAGDLDSVASYVETMYCDNPVVKTVRAQRQFGTAGDLILAIREQPDLFGDHIVINNVDTILKLDADDFVEFHRSTGATLSIALTRNRGVPNQDAFYVDKDGLVVYSAEATVNPLDYDKALKLTSRKGSSTGAVIVDTNFLKDADWEPTQGQLSLYRDIMGAALVEGSVAGYDNGNGFFMDVGTAQTWIASVQTGMLQPYLSYPIYTNNIIHRVQQ